MTTANPLLDFSDLPRFDLVQPEHVKPAIESLLTAGRTLIERLTADSTPATWADFAGALADGLEDFGRAWGVVGHLHSVNDVPAWREAYNEMLPEVSRFYAELGQNLKLFEKYKALRESAEYATLTVEQKKVVDNEVRDFRLSGAELPEEQKPRFQAIMEELSQLSAKFAENLLDATNAFAEIVTDEALLAGLPEDALAAAKTAAEKAGVAGWKFTLHAPSYGPVMQYADNRELRARLYRAYGTRAAEFTDGTSKPEWDNTPLMQRMLALRQEDAQMLGFNNFAEVSLAPKMADSPAQVLAFLRELAAKAKPFAEKDIAELRAFARDELGMSDFQPWDAAYVSEKLLQARYAFSEQEVKQYFTEPKVLGGLFKVIESLFNVKVKPDTAPVWHEDVKFFRLETSTGELVGQFYLDLYARETKRGGAWMDEARARRRTAGGIQKPIAYLNCNFARPNGDKPATFTHDEVNTLFHETGHGLHHLLTRGEELGVSGIHGVEWDAVELPSQFMENYCWEWEVVEGMTAHVDTGATLPRALFDKMLAARNFQGGMMMVRQIEFSLFDMLIHSDFDPKSGLTVMDVLNDVRKEVAVLLPPVWQRFPNSFSHIFGGGYGAGYFSYKWAEVLSADAYAAFEEAGNPFDATVGQRFLDEILSVGGSRPAIESFKAFRGREPSVDALLRHSGMVAA
ncbi:M3 family metallopeptidase [Quatrionicoccus australiensis]|uniref:M3 family metallopeptidase n=1 Tax=Quatrionicoccus australiensis TaxID=138118 RepID=UPI001CFA9A7B|nr:M3 family metallopeptidase [Quatrionicoccus australiensis]MCB4360619.1 M3 family metallopeptidase [Quatrionicoccus australiensis]